MAQTDAQRLYAIECSCGVRREGIGPEAYFVEQAKAEGWQQIQRHAWLCPDCAEQPTEIADDQNPLRWLAAPEPTGTEGKE